MEMVFMTALEAIYAGQGQNSTPGVDDDGLGLRGGTADVEVDIVVPQTGIAVDWQQMVWQHFLLFMDVGRCLLG
jgi:hypothetical protein